VKAKPQPSVFRPARDRSWFGTQVKGVIGNRQFERSDDTRASWENRVPSLGLNRFRIA
jgi:hypothetical protein